MTESSSLNNIFFFFFIFFLCAFLTCWTKRSYEAYDQNVDLLYFIMLRNGLGFRYPNYPQLHRPRTEALRAGALCSGPHYPTSSNTTSFNTSIFMDLKFKRVSTFIALSYVDLNITLFYNSNRSSSVGYHVFPGFVQGHKRMVHRKMVVHWVPWEDAVEKVSGGSAVVFTVVVATKYRVERCSDHDCSYTQATTKVVDADVAVDGSGVSKKVIE